MSKVPTLKMNDGLSIPQFGLGVWRVKSGDEVVSSVLHAIKSGYRLIDTAMIYGNEEGVGEAIRKSGVPRSELFITTKLWNTDQGYDKTLEAFEASLKRLELDYVDLYLIHWPNHNEKLTSETWRAFEKLYKDKKTRSIGVSNFKPTHLATLLKSAKIIPAVNQIELHPYNAQLDTRDFCNKHGILVESYSPLMHGGDILNEPVIKEIAKKHSKSTAQIVLRWHIENGLIVIPKSVTPERINQNIDIFDFKLSDKERNSINGLNKSKRVGADPDGLEIKLYNVATRFFRINKK